MTLSELFSVTLCFIGLFFFFAGTVGLIRFPDTLSRLHALTKADNLGLGLIVIGLIPQLASILDVFKLILVWFLIIVSSAACSYLIASQITRHEPVKTNLLPELKNNKESNDEPSNSL
jgi:multicomponent Na+:H+ antiporter subunit G